LESQFRVNQKRFNTFFGGRTQPAPPIMDEIKVIKAIICDHNKLHFRSNNGTTIGACESQQIEFIRESNLIATHHQFGQSDRIKVSLVAFIVSPSLSLSFCKIAHNYHTIFSQKDVISVQK
jgi:hypothetical protein